MKITIRVRYKTRFGQALFLCGDHERFGAGRPETALALRYLNTEFWEATLDLPRAQIPASLVNYYFFVRDIDGSVIEDCGAGRELDFAALPRGHSIIIDSWNDPGAIENIFSAEPFKAVLLRTDEKPAPANPAAQGSHWFNVKAPFLPNGQTVCLLGGAGPLGNWVRPRRCCCKDCPRVPTAQTST